MPRSLLVLLPLLACAHVPSSRDTTNAILWVQTSAEYEIAVRQSYLLAQRRLEESLASGPTAPALVMDLDETVLDNSTFEARLIARDADFDMEEWRRWLAGTEARAMPGAPEFVAEARRRGVEVFFVTNRHERYRGPTRATLAKLGLVPAGDDGAGLLMRGERPEWDQDKASRRAHVAAGRTLIMLVGDDLNDFVSALGKTPEERRALARENAARFGRDWILIPSPSWGSWLDALHDYQDLPLEQMRARHLERLRLDGPR